MRTRLLMLATLFLAFVGLTVPALAELNETLYVDIPFSFVAGTETLPAGHYRIDKVDDGSWLLIRNQRTNQSEFVEAIPTKAEQSPNKTDVVFQDVNGRHYMYKIWAVGNSEGEQLVQPPSEARMVPQSHPANPAPNRAKARS